MIFIVVTVGKEGAVVDHKIGNDLNEEGEGEGGGIHIVR